MIDLNPVELLINETKEYMSCVEVPKLRIEFVRREKGSFTEHVPNGQVTHSTHGRLHLSNNPPCASVGASRQYRCD